MKKLHGVDVLTSKLGRTHLILGQVLAGVCDLVALAHDHALGQQVDEGLPGGHHPLLMQEVVDKAGIVQVHDG